MGLKITVQVDTTVPSGGRIRIVNQSVTGPAGTNGVGVPAGGATGTLLNKTSNADYATGWVSRATLAADSAFSTAYAAKTHASTHGAAGADPVTLAQSQVTNLTTDLAARALIVNTNGNAGKTIYVGTVDPVVGYTPVTGDVWIQPS